MHKLMFQNMHRVLSVDIFKSLYLFMFEVREKANSIFSLTENYNKSYNQAS